MKNNSKIFFFILLLIFCFSLKSLSAELKKFMSLKNNKVYLRQGPSFEYPVKLIYKKKYLPVEIIDRSETWRKIKDFEKNSGWIHISQLSRKKSALNIKNNSILYKKPTIYSKPIAKLESGRLVLVKKCKNKWCKVISDKYAGWVFINTLWGSTK